MNVTIIREYEIYPGLILEVGQKPNIDDRLARKLLRDGYAVSKDYEPQSEKEPAPQSGSKEKKDAGAKVKKKNKTK